jgi:hypothetical protein
MQAPNSIERFNFADANSCSELREGTSYEREIALELVEKARVDIIGGNAGQPGTLGDCDVGHEPNVMRDTRLANG